ncbi:hypothetical protein HYU12_04085 [Candidatus Woesearchaeota archaeon]|nr:hypothetical protein [Candidatus Woesearchaeota archaeon]
MAEIEFKGHRFDTGLIIVFTSCLVLLIWILLKLFRVIQTPLIFEMLPIITGLAMIFGFGVSAGKIMQVIKHLQENDKETNRKLESLINEHIMLKADFKHYARYKKSIIF